MNKIVKADIQRLRKYAKELGGQINIHKQNSRKGHDAGYYFFEEKRAVAFKGPRTSWKDVVLYLIHEMAHMAGHMKYGNDALHKKAFKHIGKSEENWPKETRRAFYLFEKRDINTMHKIWRKAGIKSVTLEDVLVEQMYDTQVYEHFWKTGKHMPKVQREALRNECEQVVTLGLRGK